MIEKHLSTVPQYRRMFGRFVGSRRSLSMFCCGGRRRKYEREGVRRYVILEARSTTAPLCLVSVI